MKKYWLFLIVLVFLVISGTVVLRQLKGPSDTVQETIEIVPARKEEWRISASPSPTPFPFQELTVPYLRERAYESSLAVLKPAYERPRYTAYLTSYASDNFKIFGLLTKPKGEMPTGGWPAVIFVHGYIPPARYQTLQNYADYVDYLARSGLVVFKIDLRGHGTSEGEPGGAYYSSDYVIDVLHAYNALQSESFVKKNGIGLWGHSMAGNVVMRAAVAKPAIPAIVVWAGAVYTYVDMRTFRISDASYVPPPSSAASAGRRRELIEKMGTPSAESLFWQQVAPSSFLADLKGAIQIHHAVNDDVVSVEYSRNLVKLLDDTVVPHELHEYSNGGHNLMGASFTLAMRRTVDFFQENLNKPF